MGKKHTSLILLDVKTTENLIHKYYILTFPSYSWFNILPNSYFQMEARIKQRTTGQNCYYVLYMHLSTSNCICLPRITKNPFTDFFFPSFFLKSELIYWIFKITLKFRSSFLICWPAKNPTTITKKRGLLHYISFSTDFSLPEGLQW